MKKIFLSVLTLLFFSVQADVLVVEGKFLNKNIFVHNGFGHGGVGFCAKEVKVNGRITTDETNSSTFEVDLKVLQLKYGESITIEIIHGEGCIPKILNPEDLKPLPTFEILTMDISQQGMLHWTSKSETGALPYTVEQFKWNKWVPVGEVDGIGSPGEHNYSFQLAMHSGENKFRVKQKGLNSAVRVSKEVTVVSSLNKPSFEITKNPVRIEFTAETGFEIYDAYGSVVKRGFGKQVPIDNLGKGKFYLCYDNTLSEFKK